MKILRFILFLVTIAFASNVTAQTVYTTKTGEKYHKNDCRYLKYSKKETTIDKAKSIGYTACKVCKPNKENTKVKAKKNSNAVTLKAPVKTTTKTTVSQCTGKTKSGNRCKRKTKNANGRCYQH